MQARKVRSTSRAGGRIIVLDTFGAGTFSLRPLAPASISRCFLVQIPVRDYIAHPERSDRPNTPHSTT